ncbi:hypothetical protein JCM8547_009151 [Rhodosporidiobolus lusitaniae]
MPIVSPAYYDALFLQKMKLLLEGALRAPSRIRGQPQSTYEDFVEGLDVHDRASGVFMERLLSETTKRRPPKSSTASSYAGAAPGASSLSNVPLVRRRERVPFGAPRARLAGAVSSEEDSDSDSMDDVHSGRTMPAGFTPSWGGRARRRILRQGEDEEREDRNSPAGEARQQQIDALFGYLDPPDPLPSLASLNSGLLSPGSSTPAPRAASPPASSSTSDFGLPTYEELWFILSDDAFPQELVLHPSFAVFRSRLNAIINSSTPLSARDFPSLIAELSLRDPALPIHIRNSIARRPRTGRSSAPSTSARRSPAPAAGEGIWRTSFIEHLEESNPGGLNVVMSDDGTSMTITGSGSSRAGGAGEAGERPLRSSFSDFSRQRRALWREREGEGAGSSQAASVNAMDVDAPAAATSGSALEEGAGTPTITVTDASTPATSFGPSPPACAESPSAAPLPPRPPTSASIAEAHARFQRSIAPLPSTISSSSSSAPAPSAPEPIAPTSRARMEPRSAVARGGNEGLRAVVDALSRARERLRDD